MVFSFVLVFQTIALSLLKSFHFFFSRIMKIGTPELKCSSDSLASVYTESPASLLISDFPYTATGHISSSMDRIAISMKCLFC